MMNFLAGVLSSISLLWWVALIISALGLGATCVRALETKEARTKRAERKNKQELRSLAVKISIYGQSVHQRYPTGDVVVSERDLAEQLRKRPDTVVIVGIFRPGRNCLSAFYIDQLRFFMVLWRVQRINASK